VQRAGYDPRRMADMFRTIEQQSRGSGGPEWLSDHPNPGNRYDAIQREAAMLRIEGSRPSEAEFSAVRNRLGQMPPAYTAEQIARAQQSGRRLPGGGDTRSNDPGQDDYPVQASGRVAPPSSREQTVRVGNVLTLRIPSNWRQANDGNNSVTFAPEGAFYRDRSGQTGFTHGIQLAVVPNEAHNLQEATNELIDSLQQGNPQLRPTSGLTRDVIDGRNAISVDLRNVSEATGRAERVLLSTVALRDGAMLYIIGVTPQEEVNAYAPAIRRAKQSIQLSDQALGFR
jgi:hypothetical protein